MAGVKHTRGLLIMSACEVTIAWTRSRQAAGPFARKYSNDSSSTSLPSSDFAVGGGGDLLDDLPADPFQLGEEPAVLLRELGFELLAQVAGVGRTVALRPDRDLQIASLDHRRHEEIAKLRLIDDVAEDLQFLAVLIHLLVDVLVVRGGDDKNGLRDVLFGVLGRESARRHDGCTDRSSRRWAYGPRPPAAPRPPGASRPCERPPLRRRRAPPAGRQAQEISDTSPCRLL